MLYRSEITLTKGILFFLVFLTAVSALLDVSALSLLIVFLQKSMSSSFEFFGKVWKPEQTIPLLALFFFLKAVFNLLIQNQLLKKLHQSGLEMSLKKYKSYASAGPDAFSGKNTPQSLHELNSVILVAVEGLFLPAVSLLAEFLVFTGLLLLLLWFYPQISLFLLLGIMPIASFLLYYNHRKIQRISKEMNLTKAKIMRNSFEYLQAYSEMLLNGVLDQHTGFFTEYLDRFKRIKITYNIGHAHLPFRLLEYTAVLSLFMIIYFSSGDENQWMTIAVFGAVAFRIIPSINRIIGGYSQIQLYSFVLDFFAKPVTEIPQMKSTSSEAIPLSFAKEIRLKNICFGYPGKDTALLEDLDLIIPQGKIIGLTGSSGTGKSTLLHILAALYPPKSGEISIDGESLTSDQIKSYHQMVAYVEQKVFLSDDSIATNIGFMDRYVGINENKLMEAIEKSQLQDWVNDLPYGVDTAVGEHGTMVSGGQMQRIALARALYKGASLFLLDEITNALDKATEEQVMMNLRKLSQEGKTIVLVSHHADVLAYCDVIYELKSKKLVTKQMH